MRCIIAIVGIAAFSSTPALNSALAEPVLLLNEPRDIEMAKGSCSWAEGEIKDDQYLIKAFKCAESDLCQRAIDINAACRVGGPVAEVKGFLSKLLAQFASNPQCAITIMRLRGGNSADDARNNLEGYKRANWELNLGFATGSPKQSWALWPYDSGNINPAGVLEGEGDASQIARDVCTIVIGKGAKISN